MSFYKVEITQEWSVEVEVEAESTEEAEDRALDTFEGPPADFPQGVEWWSPTADTKAVKIDGQWAYAPPF